jgi:hypothetical protein
VHRSRKPEWVYAHRGFESHPLRHKRHKSFSHKKAQKAQKEEHRIDEHIQNEPSIPFCDFCAFLWLIRRGAGVVELAALEML